LALGGRLLGSGRLSAGRTVPARRLLSGRAIAGWRLTVGRVISAKTKNPQWNKQGDEHG
jgi:hypothetical protein